MSPLLGIFNSHCHPTVLLATGSEVCINHSKLTPKSYERMISLGIVVIEFTYHGQPLLSAFSFLDAYIDLIVC